MSIKIYSFLILLLFSSVINSRISTPNWASNVFELHKWIGLIDNQISINYLQDELDNCISNINSEENCLYANEYLILLSKLNRELSQSTANQLLKVIINTEENYLYYLKIRVIESLAYSGNVDLLVQNIKGNPLLEDSYILAVAGDYRWSNVVIDTLQNGGSYSYCRGLLYINPFLVNDSIKSVIKSNIVTNITNHDVLKSGCSSRILVDRSFLNLNQFSILELINTLLSIENFKNNKIGLYIIQKWPNLMLSDHDFISRLVEKAVSTTDYNARYYYSNLLHSLNIIVKRLPLSDQQNDFASDTQTLISHSLQRDFNEYLSSHEFNDVWKMYINNITFTEIKNWFKYIVNSADNLIDYDEKIEYLKKLSLVVENQFIRIKLIDISVKYNSIHTSELLSELYTNSTNLQKTTMIAHYPQQFDSESVVRINSSDPWIKLVEIVNILTICRIDVPPIENELLDLKKLQQYLDNAEQLFKDCGRLNQ